MAQNQNQNQNQNPAQHASTSNDQAQDQGVSVWATGGRLEVDVGNGQYVPVPNTSGREPTRDEIYQALVAAGHQDRADELADKAFGDVMGTNTE